MAGIRIDNQTDDRVGRNDRERLSEEKSAPPHKLPLMPPVRWILQDLSYPLAGTNDRHPGRRLLYQTKVG